ncbi:hypothetical protein [Congregibacter litoralis]|uniref:hypothetical protein n=1 Tax=Congregibacter litoralis TaxID=393662 RepID=UPI0012603867|nr:hypothetical protein [Congregibacter litoralis]
MIYRHPNKARHAASLDSQPSAARPCWQRYVPLHPTPCARNSTIKLLIIVVLTVSLAGFAPFSSIAQESDCDCDHVFSLIEKIIAEPSFEDKVRSGVLLELPDADPVVVEAFVQAAADLSCTGLGLGLSELSKKLERKVSIDYPEGVVAVTTKAIEKACSKTPEIVKQST